MNLSERNKKVAIARWAKKLHEERIKIPQTQNADVLKAALCGFLAGDGSIRCRKEKKSSHYEVHFFPDDDKMLAVYLRLLKKLYQKAPSIRKQRALYDVRLTSRTVFEDLHKYATFGIKKWNIPPKLVENKSAAAAWVRAFFSAEAYVAKDRIKIQTVNAKGMAELSNLLTALDIEHKRYSYTPQNPKYSKVHIIMILKKSARLKYLKAIGFWHQKKSLSLKKSLAL